MKNTGIRQSLEKTLKKASMEKEILKVYPDAVVEGSKYCSKSIFDKFTKFSIKHTSIDMIVKLANEIPYKHENKGHKVSIYYFMPLMCGKITQSNVVELSFPDLVYKSQSKALTPLVKEIKIQTMRYLKNLQDYNIKYKIEKVPEQLKSIITFL